MMIFVDYIDLKDDEESTITGRSLLNIFPKYELKDRKVSAPRSSHVTNQQSR